jgi:hypothetical protein
LKKLPPDFMALPNARLPPPEPDEETDTELGGIRIPLSLRDSPSLANKTRSSSSADESKRDFACWWAMNDYEDTDSSLYPLQARSPAGYFDIFVHSPCAAARQSAPKFDCGLAYHLAQPLPFSGQAKELFAHLVQPVCETNSVFS